MQGLYGEALTWEKLFGDIPFSAVIFCITEAITHQVQFPFVFIAVVITFFIHPDAIVFPCQVKC